MLLLYWTHPLPMEDENSTINTLNYIELVDVRNKTMMISHSNGFGLFLNFVYVCVCSAFSFKKVFLLQFRISILLQPSVGRNIHTVDSKQRRLNFPNLLFASTSLFSPCSLETLIVYGMQKKVRSSGKCIGRILSVKYRYTDIVD